MSCEKDNLPASEICGSLKGYEIQESKYIVNIDMVRYIVDEETYLQAVRYFEIYAENEDIIEWPLRMCIDRIYED